MPDITLEKTHALLEQLAEYVTTQVATRQELNELRHEMNEKFALKADVQRIDDKVDLILEGMDAQAQQLDILRTDMKAVSGTLDFHEGRLGSLEEHNFGRRVRDDKENYNPDHTQK